MNFVSLSKVKPAALRDVVIRDISLPVPGKIPRSMILIASSIAANVGGNNLSILSSFVLVSANTST